MSELVASGNVNTVPEKTLLAFADYEGWPGAPSPAPGDARATMQSLAAIGVGMDEVTAQLEREGVDKFIASWDDLQKAGLEALTR